MSFAKEDRSDKVQIDFLTQCKFELSAEVIRWKEENLKLRKESDTVSKKVEELQTLVNKLSRHIHELETSLFLSYEDNKRLRMHTVTVGEENFMLHNRLSKTKLQSLPSFDTRMKSNNQNSTQHDPTSVFSPETCEDVSVKLLNQMQKEMKQMQLFQNTLLDTNKVKVPNHSLEPLSMLCEKQIEQLSSTEMEDMNQKITNLSAVAETLKRRLALQNQKLNVLLDQDPAKNIDVRNTNKHAESCLKPSDESFRAYFIQQLGKASNIKEKNKIACEDSRFGKDNSQSNVESTEFQDELPKRNDKLSKTDANTNRKNDEKICPICKVAFPLGDSEFEDHVMTHLKAFSETLLTQYEIV